MRHFKVPEALIVFYFIFYMHRILVKGYKKQNEKLKKEKIPPNCHSIKNMQQKSCGVVLILFFKKVKLVGSGKTETGNELQSLPVKEIKE